MSNTLVHALIEFEAWYYAKKKTLTANAQAEQIVILLHEQYRQKQSLNWLKQQIESELQYSIQNVQVDENGIHIKTDESWVELSTFIVDTIEYLYTSDISNKKSAFLIQQAARYSQGTPSTLITDFALHWYGDPSTANQVGSQQYLQYLVLMRQRVALRMRHFAALLLTDASTIEDALRTVYPTPDQIITNYFEPLNENYNRTKELFGEQFNDQFALGTRIRKMVQTEILERVYVH